MVKVIHIQQLDKNGDLKWEASNLHNMLHNFGEQLLLQALFTGGNAGNIYIPDNYYFGLDSRATVAATDTILTLAGEPSGTVGYARQSVSSLGDFSVEWLTSAYRATCPVISFHATGIGYSAKNLFLTDATDNSGTLIATVTFPDTMTLAGGDVVSMKMALSLKDCP